jgi:hypothetical protein
MLYSNIVYYYIVMGGSVLPATIDDKGVLRFLFGKERDIDENPGWSDFGGGTEDGESYMTTAIREGGEELTGFLGDSKDIKKLLNRFGTYNVTYPGSNGHGGYRVHIFPMEYDEYLPHYYNNNQRFIQKRLDPKVIRDTKIFEKQEIKWWSISDIKKGKKQFRSFYQEIVDMILADADKISKFIFAKLGSKKIKSVSSKSRKTRKH